MGPRGHRASYEMHDVHDVHDLDRSGAGPISSPSHNTTAVRDFTLKQRIQRYYDYCINDTVRYDDDLDYDTSARSPRDTEVF